MKTTQRTTAPFSVFSNKKKQQILTEGAKD